MLNPITAAAMARSWHRLTRLSSPSRSPAASPTATPTSVTSRGGSPSRSALEIRAALAARGLL